MQIRLPMAKIHESSIVKPYYKRIYVGLSKFSGVWYMLAANIMLTCSMFSLKFVPADLFDVMIVRHAVQSLAFGSFAIYKHYNLLECKGQPIAAILNVTTSSMMTILYVAAFYFLSLPDLNTIKHTYIVWTMLMAVMFLGERLKIINGISVLLALTGLTLITKPTMLIHFIQRILGLRANISSSNNQVRQNACLLILIYNSYRILVLKAERFAD
jgi:drug/metabolite transporter (DMT)-like permease